MENMERNQAGRICPRGTGYYIWRTGDTLASVALAAKTTAQAIQVLNPETNFATLPAGTEICLPNQVVLELHTPETLAEVFGATE